MDKARAFLAVEHRNAAIVNARGGLVDKTQARFLPADEMRALVVSQSFARS